MEIVMAFGVLAAMALLWAAARSATTVCVLEVRDGKVEIGSGTLSPRVLADVRDVVRGRRVGSKKKKVARATIRVTRDRDRAAVSIRGDLSDAQQQQVRNVIGLVPLAKLVGERRRKR